MAYLLWKCCYQTTATTGLIAESTNTSTGAATADDENAFRKPTTTAGVPATTIKGNGWVTASKQSHSIGAT